MIACLVRLNTIMLNLLQNMALQKPTENLKDCLTILGEETERLFGSGMIRNILMIDDVTFFLGSIQDEYDADLLELPILAIKELLSDEHLQKLEVILEK